MSIEKELSLQVPSFLWRANTEFDDHHYTAKPGFGQLIEKIVFGDTDVALDTYYFRSVEDMVNFQSRYL